MTVKILEGPLPMRSWSLKIEGRPRLPQSKEYSEWAERISSSWIDKYGGEIFPTSLPLTVALWFTFGDRRHTELSGYVEGVLQALSAFLERRNIRLLLTVAVDDPASPEGVDIYIAPFYRGAAFQAWQALYLARK